MSSRSSWCDRTRAPTDPYLRALPGLLVASALALIGPSTTIGADAPPWMHALVGVTLPPHKDSTNAVLLYSEDIVTVRSDGRLLTRTRKAYRILRPDGERLGIVRTDFDSQTRITDIHGWCIPVSGKDLVVKDKDTAETALPGLANGYLVSDLQSKVMRIPEAAPGSIIGWEVEQEIEPYSLNDEWDPEDTIPVREARFTLLLPAGWTYRATWINHPDIAPVESPAKGARQYQWVLSDLAAVPIEEHMPPWRGVAPRMVISVAQTGTQSSGWNSWADLGNWYLKLLGNRRDPSPEIRARVTQLTASEPSGLGKIRALARFVQSDIRYVAIELGIGGHQPHPAAEVFAHRYGDCKDKATLLSSMLQLIGVSSFPVMINTTRGMVTPGVPANTDFDHVILAIQLPPEVDASGLAATMMHPQLGKLLFFDPTDELTPVGRLAGVLQSNYGLLVRSDDSDLVLLPQLTADSSGVRRTATMALDETGTLTGDIVEAHLGDAARAQRELIRGLALDTDRIKPIEARVARSLPSFQIVKASVGNVSALELPFEWRYSLEAQHYARASGALLLVRPRVVGNLAQGFLETSEDRRQPIEFEGPARDTDIVEIALPNHYKVDELPSPVNVDFGFAAYRSKTELAGEKLRFSRSFEIKQLSVPAAKATQLRDLYRIISDDERRAAVLVRTTP